MNSKEIVQAMTDRSPVQAKGVVFDYIIEYVLTIDERGQQRRSAVLLDKASNSTMRVPIDQVETAEK